MSQEVNLDQLRSEALVRINRSERHFKLALLAAAIWELLFLGLFIAAADFHNRLHLIIVTGFDGKLLIGGTRPGSARSARRPRHIAGPESNRIDRQLVLLGIRLPLSRSVD